MSNHSEPDQRIAIYTSSMKGGGAQRAMMNLAQGLCSRGYQIDLVLSKAEGPYLKELPEQVRLIDLNSKRVLNSLFPLVRYLRKERPVAMVSSLDYVNIIAIWARWLSDIKCRLVINEQNTLSKAALGAKKWRNRFTPWLAKHFYPRADEIVACAEDVKEDLEQVLQGKANQIEVIFNSVVREMVLAKASQPAPHPWFQPGMPPVVLAVGRLSEQKDYPTLIKAFAILRKQRPVRLMILGEGHLHAELKQQVEDLQLQEDVSLPGFADNPFACMNQAELFVMSSRWEGMPLVMIEALCCGVPVVSTDCPSGPREILHKPEYGTLVPMNDPEKLAQTMADKLSQPRKSPPEASWAQYEINHVVDRYLDLLFPVTTPENEIVS